MKDESVSSRAIEPFWQEFDDILRVVDLSSGFVLLPIEVPGPDLARRLAHWLTLHSHPTMVVAPETSEDWNALASVLLSATPEDNGVVLVVESGISVEDLSRASRLVNERRDQIAKHLNCPLLWCGSSDFLVQTGQLAPDFWSVRAVERRLEWRPRMESKPAPSSRRDVHREELTHEALRQNDRKSAEVLFLARLRDSMYGEAPEDFEAAVSEIPRGLEEADSEFGLELALMKAEMARRRGRIADALEILDVWKEKVQSPDEVCRIELLRGRVWEKAGDAARAEQAYGCARETVGTKNGAWPLIAGMYWFALRGRTRDKDVRPGLRELVDAAKVKGDSQIVALGLAFLSEATARRHNLHLAGIFLYDGRHAYEMAKEHATILFAGEVDEAFVRAKTTIADAKATVLDARPEMFVAAKPKRPVDASNTSKEVADQRGGQESKIAEEDRPIVRPPVGIDERPAAQNRQWFVWVLAAAIVGILVSMGVSYFLRRSVVYCFQASNGEITCAESFEACEQMRTSAGTSRSCQKVRFGTMNK